MKNIDVVILCGGKGERLRSIIDDRPKPMASFKGRPFLSILINYLACFGFQRFILCTGYKGSFIKDYYSNHPVPGNIVYSKEQRPLGTGGALKKAKTIIKSEHILVLNGDSFCRLDLNKFVAFHLLKKARLSIALARRAQNKTNCARVVLNRRKQIIDFAEKSAQRSRGWCSTGVYLMNRDIFSSMGSQQRFSLEYDFLPRLLKDKNCYGFVQDCALLDIGTPEGYKKAQCVF